MSSEQLGFDFSGREARRRRDEGIDRVENKGPAFTERVRELVGTLPAGLEISGEDIRLRCEEAGIRPHHHNAWGAAIMSCVRRSLIVRTGELVNCKRPESHARANPRYRVNR